MTNPPVIEWREDAVHIIDQRVLPHAVEILHCHEAADVCDAIRSLAIRGAPALGVAAAYAIALGAVRISTTDTTEFLAKLDAIIEQVIATRPTAVNLPWAAEQMRATAKAQSEAPIDAIRNGLIEKAHAITQDNERRHRALAEAGADLFRPNDRVLHHCNTGPLATAASYGTALGVVHVAHQRHGIHVIVSETRPLLQGARLTTWELDQWNIPFTLISDSMSADLMRRGRIDAVIVGADRIAANGDVANKIGTYAHALAARAHGLPFYVAAPASTIDFNTATGDAIPIEERDPAEVRGFHERQWALTDAAVSNPAFDITPSGLVSAIVTENGVHNPPFLDSLQKPSESSADTTA